MLAGTNINHLIEKAAENGIALDTLFDGLPVLHETPTTGKRVFIVEEDGITRYQVGNRGTMLMLSQRIESILAQRKTQKRESEITSGERVEFRNDRGTWCLYGAHLTRGQRVTVTRRDGSTSEQIVGRILRTEGGMTWAEIGTQDDVAVAELEAAGAAPAHKDEADRTRLYAHSVVTITATGVDPAWGPEGHNGEWTYTGNAQYAGNAAYNYRLGSDEEPSKRLVASVGMLRGMIRSNLPCETVTITIHRKAPDADPQHD